MPRTPTKKASKKHEALFIVFEGGEGAGKSTQIARLAAFLESRGEKHRTTREPGGSGLGIQLRQMILSNRSAVLPRAELLLYEADRAQHVETVIRPALESGQHVVCDRHTDSSIVYQGMARGLGEDVVQTLNRFAVADVEPDCTIVIDIPPEVGLQRVRSRGRSAASLDRIEKEDLSFHRKVRQGFLKLARRRPAKYRVFDGELPEAELAEQITSFVWKKLEKKGERRSRGKSSRSRK